MASTWEASFAPAYLMRNQLRTHPRKIRYDDAAAELALERLSPGRTTAEAVERGCTLMLRGLF
jgi:type III pantothenate kinase